MSEREKTPKHVDWPRRIVISIDIKTFSRASGRRGCPEPFSLLDRQRRGSV